MADCDPERIVFMKHMWIKLYSSFKYGYDYR